MGIQKVRLQLVGKTYGRLTVLDFDSVRNNHSYWKVKCDCGVEKVLQGHLLTSGHSQSCGCLQREIVSKPKSEEHKRKIREGNKGKMVSEDTKIKMSKAAEGRVCSEETCRKISESHKGKYDGKNNPFYGRKHSIESRKKISKAGIGNKYNWKFDKTDEERQDDRSYPEYAEWRNLVYERDNYTCQKCDIPHGKLNAHHVESYSTNKELRLDINNGITLCKKCHKEFHHRYGKSGNTRIQLDEFLNNKQTLATETKFSAAFSKEMEELVNA